MYRAYFDCGTTNTRMSIVDADLSICYKSSRETGSKDVALSGEAAIMSRCMHQMYCEGLRDLGISDAHIGEIYASGMATSLYGIREIPHLVTPVSVSCLASSVSDYFEPRSFNRYIRMIPGIKTPLDGSKGIAGINNMRGEEIEIFGIEGSYSNLVSMAIVLPGSHTHTAYVVDGVITDIYSCIWGELYYALRKDTIIGGATAGDFDEIDEDYLLMGYRYLNRYGFNRSVYICHAMKVFDHGSAVKRHSYFEGVITASIIDGVTACLNREWPDVRGLVIAAKDSVFSIYYTLFKQALPDMAIYQARAQSDSDYALDGFRRIILNK